MCYPLIFKHNADIYYIHYVRIIYYPRAYIIIFICVSYLYNKACIIYMRRSYIIHHDCLLRYYILVPYD